MRTICEDLAMMRRAVAISSFVVLVLLTTGGVEPAGATNRSAGSTRVAEAATADWRQVSAGAVHTCGIRTSGRLYCWGDDDFSQLGNGGANTDVGSPVEVAGNHTDWVTVSAGGFFTCARRSSGRLYCWGADTFGAVGNGAPNANVSTPVEVAGSRTDWRQLSAGHDHVCAKRSSGQLFCWGSDGTGAVGDGPGTQSQSSPVQVSGGFTNWASVSAGFQSTCARRTTGRLYCWGFDNTGQTGNGLPNADLASPTEVAGNATDWSAVDGGFLHMCAKRTSGFLYCWGYDSDGQLGDGGSDSPVSSPVLVGG